MTSIDKRDAAQRAMDFLREKNIKLKRADALELLANLSGAPNWNVLQAAMRTTAKSPSSEPVVAPATWSPDIPEYIPAGEAVYAANSRLVMYKFKEIALDAIQFCRDIAGAELTHDSRKSEYWDELATDFEALKRMNDVLLQGLENRASVLPQTLRDAPGWLKTLQQRAAPVLEVLEERIAENKSRRVGPLLPEVLRRLYVRLKSIVVLVNNAITGLRERESYDMRIVYLDHIEKMVTFVLEKGGADGRDKREACESALQAARAALQLKNNVRKLTR